MTISENTRTQARRLVTVKHPNEEAVRLRLGFLLESLGYDIEPEYTTSDGGRMDIFLPQRRVVFETKRTGTVDPEAVRDPNIGETQFQQCERYVKVEWERERARFDFDQLGDLPWRAVLTDGRIWWLWQWEILSTGELSSAQVIVSGWEYTTRKSADSLAAWLSNSFERIHGKPWAPRAPAQLFERMRDELRNEIYPALKEDAGTRTKRDLWLDVLRSSGNAPSGELEQRPDDSPYVTTAEGDDLFITHTILITIARAVGRSLQNGQRNASDDPLSYVDEGFAAWPFAPGADSEPTHQPGADWVRRVFEVADRYDWRARSRDVLRALYQDMVPPEQRRAFGEFYTPDWLAEMLVERLLDDDWLSESVAHALNADPMGVGVLDPACGSGTFLYHAARRIVRYMREQGYQDGKIAEVASRLVYGIDIHPVAVEFSRANILRALPVDPPNGLNSINVVQGDSLIYSRSGMTLENQENVPYYLVETPLHQLLGIPVSWTDQESFADDLRRFVLAANSIPPKPMPVGIAMGLSQHDTQIIENTFNTLIEVCRDEKDSVWGWYFQNIVGPSKLRRRKVNRILANPPWVRMSHIQTAQRKSELETLANELGFWGHGKANTSFDIAGLFVKRCAQNYLAPGGGLAAWVLPQGALDGMNWENVRNDPYTSAGALEYMDIGKVRKAPFTVESCVWLQTHSQGQEKPDQDQESQSSDVTTKILTNLEGSPKLEPHTSYDDVKLRTNWVDAPRKLPKAKSSYLSTNGESPFRLGAALVPHCLVKVATNTLETSSNFANFSTTPSTKKPWSSKGTLNGKGVPARWIHSAAFSTSMFPFTLRRELDKVVLPLNENGLYDESAKDNGFWVNAEAVYRDGKGKGKNTPDTLWGQVDFQNKLTRQTTSVVAGEGLRKVLYNKSGRIGLRSARVPPSIITNDTLYHLTCSSESEAAYLTSLFNADCLQEAYRQSQRTRRHFDLHFWHTVPIPKYDPRNPTHIQLADLCKQAEVVAEEIRDSFPDNAGQIRVSDAIHQALRERGIADQIDDAARQLMPDQSS